MPLRREVRGDDLWRTEPRQCLTLRRLDRQPALQSVFYCIDEMFTRLVDDPPVLQVHASGARAQGGSNTPRAPLMSCGTLHHCVNRPGEVAPLAVPLRKRAVTRSGELVDAPAAAVDL